jgi:hypothetical protein
VSYQLDTMMRESLNHLFGLVSGSIAPNQDFHELAGIIQFQKVRELLLDGCTLVKGRNDETESRLELSSEDGPPAAQESRNQQGWIPKIDIDNKGQAGPENHVHVHAVQALLMLMELLIT